MTQQFLIKSTQVKRRLLSAACLDCKSILPIRHNHIRLNKSHSLTAFKIPTRPWIQLLNDPLALLYLFQGNPHLRSDEPVVVLCQRLQVGTDNFPHRPGFSQPLQLQCQTLGKGGRPYPRRFQGLQNRKAFFQARQSQYTGIGQFFHRGTEVSVIIQARCKVTGSCGSLRGKVQPIDLAQQETQQRLFQAAGCAGSVQRVGKFLLCRSVKSVLVIIFFQPSQLLQQLVVRRKIRESFFQFHNRIALGQICQIGVQFYSTHLQKRTAQDLALIQFLNLLLL